MKNTGLLSKLLLGAAFLCAPAMYSQDASALTPEVPRVTESEQRLGAFTLGGQAYAVMTRSQTISRASNKRFATTVSELEIRDANANAVYQENFPASIADGRFMQALAVSGSLLEGAGGQALMLRFVEDSGTAGGGESWQMFGLVNGKLTRYGAPLPLGQGGVAVNGVLTGVMLSGGIGVVPLASRAEALEFRVWAGSFFVSVPVRIDWASGQWSEAEQCFANTSGKLEPVGCNLRVALNRRPVAEGAAVTLYAQPEENAYNARQVTVRGDSAVEFPAARALVKWQNGGDRFTCSFDDLWLRVRIDGNEGWVHSATDFAALGLPAAGAAQ
jgi:hypothetical protein